ncbi:MAG: sulfite oxidase-like oxidoreductase [Chloroflexi bacterium]|nr:sulfite oxidase-like oxidoreductase [Chloroflexota bacterium]
MADIIRSPDTERENRLPPGQRLTTKFPVLHYGGVPPVDLGKWSLTISGLVRPERKLSYNEFISLPQVKVLSDVHCVTSWSRLNNLWEGVSSRTIRDVTEVLPRARFVMVHAPGGYSANLPVDEFFAVDVLFAHRLDNETLKPEHGYPLRLVVPALYLWKSVKWVERVEFLESDQAGFWESHGYHIHGDPWQEERFS